MLGQSFVHGSQCNLKREQTCCCCMYSCLCSCMHPACDSEVYGSVDRPPEWTMPVSQQAQIAITAMSCASMLAQQQAQLPQVTSGVAILSTDTFVVPYCTSMLLKGPRGAMCHTLIPHIQRHCISGKVCSFLLLMQTSLSQWRCHIQAALQVAR